MKTTTRFSSRLRHLPLPALSLLALLQRAPAVSVTTGSARDALSAPVAAILKSFAALASSLGAMNSLAGATPLVPSAGSEGGTTVDAGGTVSIAFTVTPTQTPIRSWKLSGSVAPGLDFSGLTAPGSVNVQSLVLGGTATTPGTYTATLQAFDGLGNQGFASALYDYTVTVRGAASTAPAITSQPQGQAGAPGANLTLTVAASGAPAPTLQWRQNAVEVAGATGGTLALGNLQPAHAGVYTVTATNAGGAATSEGAIVGLLTTGKTTGAATELGANITHPNGNTYDQVLLNGAAATVTADPGQVTRTSFIDMNDDIVQVEFSGPGSLSVVLDGAAAPAAPANYTQAVNYLKGHAALVVSGANENSNLTVFTVGRATAFDPTGRYRMLDPIGPGNDPANNGNPIFEGRGATAYDGVADIALIAIQSTNGRFGGIRASNATFSASAGPTGIHAPGVAFDGPVFLGDLSALHSASPELLIGSAADVRVTGGDLEQANGQPVRVSGVAQLKFTAGRDSAGRDQPAKQNRAVLQQNGQDVTTQIVVNPGS